MMNTHADDALNQFACLLLFFFHPLSISSSAGFFTMPSAQSHPCAAAAAIASSRPSASAAWQILLLPLALSVWSSPGESMFTGFRVAWLYVVHSDGKTMLWHPPPRASGSHPAQGFRSDIAIWPAGVSLQSESGMEKHAVSSQHSNL